MTNIGGSSSPGNVGRYTLHTAMDNFLIYAIGYNANVDKLETCALLRSL